MTEGPFRFQHSSGFADESNGLSRASKPIGPTPLEQNAEPDRYGAGVQAGTEQFRLFPRWQQDLPSCYHRCRTGSELPREPLFQEAAQLRCGFELRDWVEFFDAFT
jgi:hypothetical protein